VNIGCPLTSSTAPIQTLHLADVNELQGGGISRIVQFRFNKSHKSLTILKNLFRFGTINEALFIFGHALDAEDPTQSERILLVSFIVRADG
jgi:hypothetical protein